MSIIKYLLFLSVFNLIFSQKAVIKSKIKTEQYYRSVNIETNQIYAIEATKIGSSQEDENNKCKSIERSVMSHKQVQVFRLGKEDNKNRNDKVFDKLTSLTDQENIIEEFEIIGSYLFMISTDGNGYFINQNDSRATLKVKTNYFQDQISHDIVIKDYKSKAMIIGKDKISICMPGDQICQEVTEFQKLDGFVDAELIEEENKYYLFLITGSSIVAYQISEKGTLKNKKIYDNTYFNASKVSFRGLHRVGKNKFILLDDLQGLRQFSTNTADLSTFKKETIVSIYDQYGCFQIVGQDLGDSLALACAPSKTSYFLLKLIKSHQFENVRYEPLETVFLHQKLYQIQYVQNLLLSRIYSGIRLFWTSKQSNNPYPYFYREAGSIFLHNAIQAKLKVVNGVKMIYLAAQDEILKYELKTVEPYVVCYSNSPITEEYKLKYHITCKESGFMNSQNLCLKEEYLTFETWEHKQVKINTLLIPFILSFIGVLFISYVLYRIYKKYSLDVESVRIKYNVDKDFDFYN